MDDFDESIQQELKHYVYALTDPIDGKPFYIGMGKGNRVFDHEKEALDTEKRSAKLDVIREIKARGQTIEYVFLRHGLNSQEAFLVESTLIDFFNTFSGSLTNAVLGHHSDLHGIMSLNEILRRYQAEPLNFIENGCVIININKKYDRMIGTDAVYEATRQKWVIDKKRIGDPSEPQLKFVLSEYRGFIVEVFEVQEWFPTSDENGRKRWGFNGQRAPESVRKKYLNRKVHKKRGMAFPLRYHL